MKGIIWKADFFFFFLPLVRVIVDAQVYENTQILQVVCRSEVTENCLSFRAFWLMFTRNGCTKGAFFCRQVN